MKCIESKPQTHRLLEPPEFFVREHQQAFLYAPFSRKTHRRVYCYTHLGYDLWVHLETDSTVVAFNERPEKIPITDGKKVTHVTPAFIVKRRDGVVEAHFISPKDSEEVSVHMTDENAQHHQPAQEALINWASEQQCRVLQWTASSLRANPIHLSNLKRLLRYVCIPEAIVSINIIEALQVAIRQHRTVTVDHLLRSLADFEEAIAMEGIAAIILDKGCYSDIERYPFHYATELSAFHAFA